MQRPNIMRSGGARPPCAFAELEQGEVYLPRGPRVLAVGEFATALLDELHVAAVAAPPVVQLKSNKGQPMVGAAVVDRHPARRGNEAQGGGYGVTDTHAG